jgi:hypothetical protein
MVFLVSVFLKFNPGHTYKITLKFLKIHGELQGQGEKCPMCQGQMSEK